ncbi:hypothetical protein, conserved [Trypanosoma brucei gambiense DAL972]|uniref:Uncharacterized protein n=2 Tax=Trypanosoma brucei TaxID=5691 RepID=D0A7V4_TRYB9|nr:hypothetical protein, conserved [Trypanosoma brucei gambiense DAL972]RHW67033.1 hypothetical protein DPX39_000026800 [Trypanosoma brucei equiperdum]CBH17755.1 hypothetical protein, conserved [Trypanosoma brucei gambiense DAL972]|eukprot:XP_011780019.1 hypothetical protein, conserved [Trypanosoma brucei gambiense DAL972]
MLQNCEVANKRVERGQTTTTDPNDDLAFERHTSAPYGPVKVKRYRIQNIVLEILLVAALCLVLAGSNSSTGKLEKDNYEVFIDWQNVWVCTDEECLTHDIETTLCKKFVTNVTVFHISALGFTIPCFLAIVFNTTMIFGNAFVPKTFMLFNLALCTVASAVAVKASVDTVSSPLCYKMTLRSLGFEYGPAVMIFGFSLAFSVLSLVFCTIFLNTNSDRLSE